MSNQTHVKTGEVRFSFCHLFEPSSFNDQKPKYSLAILIDKSDKATLDAIKKAYEAAKQRMLIRMMNWHLIQTTPTTS